MAMTRLAGAAVALMAASLCVSAARAAGAQAGAQAGAYVPPGGTIAYALDSLHWAIYQKHDKFINKTECPDGANVGPYVQFKKLFPQKYKTVVGTRLRYEESVWFPTTRPDGFVFHYATGPVALGMDLDGKTGPNDFVSPDGQKSIDNQLYRVLGCIASYRPGYNANDYFDNDEIHTDNYNRLLIEITGIKNLKNSPHVEVTVYRGLESLLMGPNDEFLPAESQTIDTLWGRRYIQHFQGKIVNGVLTTEPHSFIFPWSTFGVPCDEFMHAARFELKLTPTRAKGLIGGYTDIETWYRQTNTEESTHHQAYGRLSAPSLYKALRRMADAYPDPKTGANTAISSALRAGFVQVFIIHPKNPVLATGLPWKAEPYAGAPFPPKDVARAHKSPAQLAMAIDRWQSP